MNKGVFIVIDGPNGSGKTSICKKLYEILSSKGFKIWLTKEPTNSDLGNISRKYEESYLPYTLACLVAADRYYHIAKEIIPKLEENYIVISDRYFPSSLVLQRIDGVELEFILNLNSKILIPDITIILIASASVLYRRIECRKQEKSKFERRGIDGLKKEIQLYKESYSILKGLGYNVHMVKNEKNIDVIIASILDLLSKYVGD